MTPHHYELDFYGPYDWIKVSSDSVFSNPYSHQAGIYLWTIPYRDKYLVYYVGETGRSFFKRFEEHTRDYLWGLYRVYDPNQFAKGRKVLLWNGMWKPERRGKIEKFLERYLELAPSIHEFLGLFQVFLGPFVTDKRIRQRIEAAIADSLYEQNGVIGKFQDDDIRYWGRKKDEEPFTLIINGTETIMGLGTTLEV